MSDLNLNESGSNIQKIGEHIKRFFMAYIVALSTVSTIIGVPFLFYQTIKSEVRELVNSKAFIKDLSENVRPMVIFEG